MHKVFILIHLLYSSTCFEHDYAHPQEDIVFVQHLVPSLSLGDRSIHRLRESCRYQMLYKYNLSSWRWA